MSSRSVRPPSGDEKESHSLGRRRAGMPYMSDAQTQAYLMARDALRRIRRTSSLLFPPEVVTTHRRGRSVSNRSWDRSRISGNLASRWTGFRK
jgi:hypothetical protein